MSITTSSIGTTSASSTVQTENNTSLSMEDFFKLLCAELQNQSMLDPVSNAEFIGQMAQFSTLTKIEELTAAGQKSYAVSLLGKNVTVASTNETTGDTKTASGTVDNVIFKDSVPYIIIDGSYYLASDVVMVEKSNTTVSGNANESSDTTKSSDA